MPYRVTRDAAVLFALLAAGTAAAQDSVVGLGPFISDAPNPFDPQDTIDRYVVDLAPVRTSWGNTVGVAPLVKAPVDFRSIFFDDQLGGVAISPDLLTDRDGGQTYERWTVPGPGVSVNNSGFAVNFTTPNGLNQFAVLCQSFGGGFPCRNTITGALVSLDPDEPARLYVERVIAASNSTGPSDPTYSSLGIGSVDAHGNAYFRADTFGISGPISFQGTALYRARLDDRSPGFVNAIGTIPPVFDGIDTLINNTGAVITVPSLVPQSVVGGRGLVAANSFEGPFVRGAGPLTGQTDHVGPDAINLRGTLGSSPTTPLEGSYTFVSIARDRDTGSARSLNVFSVDQQGNPRNIVNLQPPNAVSDPTTGYSLNTTTTNGAFVTFSSQIAFFGPTGQAAVHGDPDGNLYAASTWVTPRLTGPSGGAAILVGRRDTANNDDWTVVAYVDNNTGVGKPVNDASNGDQIGTLAPAENVVTPFVSGFSDFVSPTLSNPAFDARGNIWFIAPVALDAIDRTGQEFIDTAFALIRAVPVDNGYELELVLRTGQSIRGRNTGLEYRIDSFPQIDRDGIRSGGMGANAVSATAFNALNPYSLEPEDFRNSAGVAVVADITYDVNGDLVYNDPGSIYFDNAFPIDEAYQTVLYIGYTDEVLPECPVDANNDGRTDLDDFSILAVQFGTPGPQADFNGDGIVDLDDFSVLAVAFGCGT